MSFTTVVYMSVASVSLRVAGVFSRPPAPKRLRLPDLVIPKFALSSRSCHHDCVPASAPPLPLRVPLPTRPLPLLLPLHPHQVKIDTVYFSWLKWWRLREEDSVFWRIIIFIYTPQPWISFFPKNSWSMESTTLTCAGHNSIVEAFHPKHNHMR